MRRSLFMLCLLCGISVYVSTGRSPRAASGSPRLMDVVTLEDAVNVRSLPDLESPLVGRVWHGVRMEVLELRKGWLRVEFSTGEQGWILGDFVETVSTAEDSAVRAAGASAPAGPVPETEAPYRIRVGDTLGI